MNAHPLFALLFGFALLVSCTQRSSNIPVGGALGGVNAGSGVPDPSAQFDFNDNGTLDLGTSFETSADATQDSLETLQNIPGVDPNLIQGMTMASDGLDQFANAYQQLVVGGSPQGVLPILQDIQGAKLNAWQIAQQLWQLGLTDLAQVFFNESQKIEVLRFYNPDTGRHFYTTSRPEGFQVSALTGFYLEGIGFRVFGKPRNGCARPIYRCYKPTEDVHFMSSDQSCEGQTPVTNLGFVCSERRALANLEIRRLRSPNGDYLAAVHPEEIEHVTTVLKWVNEGSLGFPPN